MLAIWNVICKILQRGADTCWHLAKSEVAGAPTLTEIRISFSDDHFNQERSLSSRPNYKANRAAALAEWRGLLVA